MEILGNADTFTSALPRGGEQSNTLKTVAKYSVSKKYHIKSRSLEQLAKLRHFAGFLYTFS
jgi:hypothetical protein